MEGSCGLQRAGGLQENSSIVVGRNSLKFADVQLMGCDIFIASYIELVENQPTRGERSLSIWLLIYPNLVELPILRCFDNLLIRYICLHWQP